MNITLVSYSNSLDFGIIACRRSLPQVQRLIDHLEEALQELEEVSGLRTVKPPKRRTVKTRVASKAKVKAKVATKKKVAPKAKRKPGTKVKPKNA